MELTRTTLDDLAHRIAVDGVAAHRRDVAAVAAAAVRSGAPAAVVDVLTDPAASAVARLRAFGMAAVALERGTQPRSLPRHLTRAAA